MKPLCFLCDLYTTVIRGIPVVVVLLIFYCQPSTPGVNRFGSGLADSGAQPAAVAHQQTKATTGTPSLEQLERLAALRASGAINETEFRQMKADAIAAGRA